RPAAPYPSRRAAQRRAPQDEGYFAVAQKERLTLRRPARFGAGRLEGWAACAWRHQEIGAAREDSDLSSIGRAQRPRRAAYAARRSINRSASGRAGGVRRAALCRAVMLGAVVRDT